MTLFPRDINIDQLGVRSLFGCLFVYVTREKAYKLVSFSARKMFLYFFLHRIQWEIQWNHQILSFTTALLRKRLKTNCNMLWNFENFLKSKSSISHLFKSRFLKVSSILELSGPQLSETLLTFSQECILRG